MVVYAATEGITSQSALAAAFRADYYRIRRETFRRCRIRRDGEVLQHHSVLLDLKLFT